MSQQVSKFRVALASGILLVSVGTPIAAWFLYLSPDTNSGASENQLLAQQAPAAGQAQPSSEDVAPKPGSVDVSVRLAEHVTAGAEQTVFIYARAWQGPPMPLAIQKLTVSDLPVQVHLDESMAMTPSMTLTSFPEIEIVARISQTGSARSEPGDWQASSGPLELNALKGPVKLLIDTQLP